MLVAAFRALSEDGQGRSCDGYEGNEWRLFQALLCVHAKIVPMSVRHFGAIGVAWRRVASRSGLVS